MSDLHYVPSKYTPYYGHDRVALKIIEDAAGYCCLHRSVEVEYTNKDFTLKVKVCK